MRNLKFLTFMLFIGLFMGGNGCRKDEVLQKTNENKKSMYLENNGSYKPFFNSDSFSQNNISGNTLTRPIAPKLNEIIFMNSNLKKIGTSTPFSQKLRSLVKQDIYPLFNYSIINYIGNNQDNFRIFVPFVKNGKIEGIMLFTNLENEISFDYVSKSIVTELIQKTPINYTKELSHAYEIINIANTFNVNIEMPFDTTLNSFTKEFTKLYRTPRGDDGNRCVSYLTWTPYQYAGLVGLLGYGGYITIYHGIHISYYACPEIFQPANWTGYEVGPIPIGTPGNGGDSGGQGGPKNPFENWGPPDATFPDVPRECFNQMNIDTRKCLEDKMNEIKSSSFCSEQIEYAVKEFSKFLTQACIENKEKSDEANEDPFGFEQALAEWEFQLEICPKLDAIELLPPLIDPKLAIDCPKAACILNNLLNKSKSTSPLFNSTYLCQMIKSLSDSDYNFAFSSRTPKSGESNFTGSAEVKNNNSIVIFLNPNNCNQIDGIELFETIQHELIHAELFRMQLKDFGLIQGTAGSFEQSFKALVTAKYGPDPTPGHHELMLRQLLPDMLNSLMEANGSKNRCLGTETSGDCFYFKTMILNGFNEQFLEEDFGLSLNLHKENVNAYNLWKLSQPLYYNVKTCQ